MIFRLSNWSFNGSLFNINLQSKILIREGTSDLQNLLMAARLFNSTTYSKLCLRRQEVQLLTVKLPSELFQHIDTSSPPSSGPQNFQQLKGLRHRPWIFQQDIIVHMKLSRPIQSHANTHLFNAT